MSSCSNLLHLEDKTISLFEIPLFIQNLVSKPSCHLLLLPTSLESRLAAIVDFHDKRNGLNSDQNLYKGVKMFLNYEIYHNIRILLQIGGNIVK